MGLLLMAFGVMFGAYHWALSILSDSPATTGTVMISVLPIILGFQLFLQAIVLEIQGMKKIPNHYEYNRGTAEPDTK